MACLSLSQHLWSNLFILFIKSKKDQANLLALTKSSLSLRCHWHKTLMNNKGPENTAPSCLQTTACVVTKAFGNTKGIKLNQVTRGNQYLIHVKLALTPSIMWLTMRRIDLFLFWWKVRALKFSFIYINFKKRTSLHGVISSVYKTGELIAISEPLLFDSAPVLHTK